MSHLVPALELHAPTPHLTPNRHHRHRHATSTQTHTSPPTYGAFYESEAAAVIDSLNNAFQLGASATLMYYGFGSESGTRLFFLGVLSAVGCRLAGPCKLALGVFPYDRMPSLTQLRKGVSPSPAGEACVGAAHCATTTTTN